MENMEIWKNQYKFSFVFVIKKQSVCNIIFRVVSLTALCTMVCSLKLPLDRLTSKEC